MKKGKSGKTVLIIVTLIIVFIVGYYILSKNKNTLNPKTGLPDVPLNPVTAGNGSIISPDSEIVKQRMKELYNNKVSRENAIVNYSVQVPTLASLKNQTGVREVLTRLGLQEIPLIPDFINSGYSKQIDALSGLRSFEELAYRSNFESAAQTYKTALFVDYLQLGFYDPIAAVAIADGFGSKKSGDNDRSNNISAGISDFVELFKKAKTASAQLGEALKSEAIKQVRAAGYKVTGYDS